MERISVASSNVSSIGYDSDIQVLEVEFLSGSIYQYFGVPEQLYETLMENPSKGTFLNANIKNLFPYDRVG